MKITAVNIGTPQPTTAKTGTTGYFKRPVDGPVEVGPEGLTGDHIADREHHGGVDQAVYLFGDPDRAWWADQLGRPCPPGFFGENLTVAGLNSATLCLGDVLEVGALMLQITAPRIPCATYGAVIGTKSALKEFYAAERPGAYARVLRSGMVQAGDPVSLVPFEGERITVVENMRAYHGNFRDTDFLRRALSVPAHHKLHAEARQRLGDR